MPLSNRVENADGRAFGQVLASSEIYRGVFEVERCRTTSIHTATITTPISSDSYCYASSNSCQSGLRYFCWGPIMASIPAWGGCFAVARGMQEHRTRAVAWSLLPIAGATLYPSE